MTAPFTPFETFSDDATPSISAAFLNDIQSQGIAPAAAVAWAQRVDVNMTSTNATSVVYEDITCMVKDSVTGKYGYVQIGAGVLTSADYVPDPGTWPASAFAYAYAYSENGVGYVEVLDTVPTTDLLTAQGDVTRRYLFAIPFKSSHAPVRIAKYGREYRYLEELFPFIGMGSSYGAWSTSPATVDLTGFVPDRIQAADIYIKAVGDSTHTYTLTISAGGRDQFSTVIIPNSTNGTGLEGSFRFWCGGLLALTAVSDSSSHNEKGYLRCLGWVE